MNEQKGYDILLNKYGIDLRKADKKSDEETRAIKIFRDSLDTEDAEFLRYCIVDYIFHQYKNDIGKRALGKHFCVEADDVVQTTMMHIFKSIHNFKQESAISSYIYKIAIMSCYEILRRDTRLKINFINIDNPEIATYNPKEHYDNVIILTDAINSLAAGYRDVITRQYFEQNTIEEIALLTGTTEGSVKSQIHKAKKKLKEIILIEYFVAA